MSLETGTYVSDLVATNPAGTDPKSQGDDHLRLIKNALKNSFPTINAPLTAALVPFSPVGSVAATDVQAAIQEVDAEKLPLSGGQLTGTLSAASGGSFYTVAGASGGSAVGLLGLDGGGAITGGVGTSYVDGVATNTFLGVGPGPWSSGLTVDLFGSGLQTGPQNGAPNALTRKDYVDGSNYLTATGFKILPGGLIIQWGNKLNQNDAAAGVDTINFPTAFPNANFCVQVSGTTGAGLGWAQVVCSPVFPATGLSSFQVASFINGSLVNAIDTVNISWIAIGY
jgi:hypothetical protein